MNTRNEHTVDVKSGTVGLAPYIDSVVTEVAGACEGHGEDGRLKIGEFHDVVLEELDSFLCEPREDDAFNVALFDTFCCGFLDVLREFLIVEIHESNSNPLFEGQ